jgi:hypothetical protein
MVPSEEGVAGLALDEHDEDGDDAEDAPLWCVVGTTRESAGEGGDGLWSVHCGAIDTLVGGRFPLTLDMLQFAFDEGTCGGVKASGTSFCKNGRESLYLMENSCSFFINFFRILFCSFYDHQQTIFLLLFINHGRIERGGLGLPKFSLGLAMPYPSTPCGRATPKTA